MRALIIGDDTFHARTILAAARALSRAGWHLGLGSPAPQLAAASRSVARWHHVPSPSQGLDGFRAAINAVIASDGYEIVFPAGDAEVFALGIIRDDIHAIVPYPGVDIVKRAFDKLELVRAGAASGLAVPWTVPATDQAIDAIDGPILVKSRFHWSTVPGAPDRLEAYLAEDRAAARVRVREIERLGGEGLLQQVIHGPVMAHVALVAPSGRVWANFEHLAVRLWPPVVGNAARAETRDPDPEVTAGVERLFTALGWFGLAQLEFVIAPDGRPHLIDFNGRFYGSQALPEDSGLRFAAAWADIATGREPAPARRVRRGTRYQWLEADLHRALAERRGGVVRDVLGCLWYRVGARHSLGSIRDPMPGVRWTLHVLGRGTRMLWRARPRIGHLPSG
jgi:predicted ATP-grasp superfamily ATP-dependent carboligase